MGRLKLIFIAALLLFPPLATAIPYYGFRLSYAAIGKEPPNLHGYQFMFTYDPGTIKWRKFTVYFDGGYTHFWDSVCPYYSSVSLYSVAPVVHYSFRKRGPITPFLELSIGIAYLNHLYFEDRKLGIHFTFQDRIGIGAAFGAHEQFSIGMHAVHYSNARLANNNSGITAPLVIDLAYKFT